MTDQGFVSEVIHEVKNLPLNEDYLLIFGRVLGILFQNPNSSIQIFLTFCCIFGSVNKSRFLFSNFGPFLIYIPVSWKIFLCLVCENLYEWFNIAQKTLDSYCAIVSRWNNAGGIEFMKLYVIGSVKKVKSNLLLLLAVNPIFWEWIWGGRQLICLCLYDSCLVVRNVCDSLKILTHGMVAKVIALPPPHYTYRALI